MPFLSCSIVSNKTRLIGLLFSFGQDTTFLYLLMEFVFFFFAAVLLSASPNIKVFSFLLFYLIFLSFFQYLELEEVSCLEIYSKSQVNYQFMYLWLLEEWRRYEACFFGVYLGWMITRIIRGRTQSCYQGMLGFLLILQTGARNMNIENIRWWGQWSLFFCSNSGARLLICEDVVGNFCTHEVWRKTHHFIIQRGKKTFQRLRLLV